MTPEEIALGAARRLWRERHRLRVRIDGAEGGWQPDRPTTPTFSIRFPHVRLSFPDQGGGYGHAGHVTMDTFTLGTRQDGTWSAEHVESDVHTPDGHHQRLSRHEGRAIRIVWNAIQAEAMTATMGEPAPVAPDPDPEGVVGKALAWVNGAPDPFLAGLVRAPQAAARSAALAIDNPAASIGPVTELRGGCIYLRSRILKGGHLAEESALSAIAHPRWGILPVPGAAMDEAIAAIRDRSFRNMLANAGSTALPANAITAGARIQRLVRLCESALRLDPDLADLDGAPIAPLVERHLPRLLATHRQASSVLPTDQMHEIDRELDVGMETVRLAVEDAIARDRDSQAAALLDELRFLSLRHPTAAGRARNGRGI